MFCMQCVIVVISLWMFPFSVICIDVTYEELEELDATCPLLDTCTRRRSSDTLEMYTCHCGSFCSKLRTCCIDSPFRDIKLPGRRPTCNPVNGENNLHYYLKSSCPYRANEDMEKKCTENQSEQENLISMVPVTSTHSNVTYKNYYCLKCNENTDKFLYWNVRINSEIKDIEVSEQDVKLMYDTDDKAWKANVAKNGDFLPVSLSIDVPDEIETLPKVCTPNAISVCSRDWKVSSFRSKCARYTSFIYIVRNGRNVLYRNPHCALCNFESLERMGCAVLSASRSSNKKPFSFSLLLDINGSDGDEVGKIQRCDQKSIWDPAARKCRRMVCVKPGQIVRDRKCVYP